MSLWAAVLFGLLWGGVLAVAVLGGLWLTLRSIAEHPRPHRRLARSWFARAALAVAGFLVAAVVGPAALAGTAAGFLTVRTAILANMSLLRKESRP